MADGSDSESGDDPVMKDPYANGVPRRRLLQASATVGATASAAGCTSALPGGGNVVAAVVYVFNTGDKTVSIIDAESNELLTTQYLGATSSWPANQHVIANPDVKTLWLNVRGGVMAFEPETLDQVADIDTGSDKNWLATTPDGRYLPVAVREPVHKYVRINADQGSDSFGTITDEIGRGESAPCDMTVGPNGEYAYVPDRAADRLTVIRIDPFEVAAEVPLEPVKQVRDVRPYMCTISWDGRYLALENQEGKHNTESIFDVSDPENPTEMTRLTQEDGIGRSPVSSEFSADSDTVYLFTVGSESITVVDLDAMSVLKQIDVGGESWTGSWDPARETLYASIVSTNQVVAIDHESQEIRATIDVGTSPRGVTARREISPPVDSAAQIQASFASLGIDFGGVRTTYCDGECHCGPMEDHDGVH